MKILICHNYYQIRAGEAQSVWGDKEMLEAHGHSVALYTKDNRSLERLNIFRRLGLVPGTVFSLSSYLDIRRLIRNGRPDVAHVHNVYPLISPSVYSVLGRSRIPIIQVLHNYRFMCPNGTLLNERAEICEKCTGGRIWPAVAGRCYRESRWQTAVLAGALSLHRRLNTFRRIDVYIAPSEFMRQRMVAAGFSSDRIVVKRHSLDLSRFHPTQDFDDYAVYMGRLSREKGIRTLIEAFAGLPSLRLEVVGDGPLKGDLEEIIQRRRLKNIRMHGFIPTERRFELLKRAALMVFPSEWYENLPYSVMEGMALGIPVLASRMGGVPEIVEDGATGWLFEPGDIDDLRSRIGNAFENPGLLAGMRPAARRAAESAFDPRRNYRVLKRVYAGLGLNPDDGRKTS